MNFTMAQSVGWTSPELIGHLTRGRRCWTGIGLRSVVPYLLTRSPTIAFVCAPNGVEEVWRQLPKDSKDLHELTVTRSLGPVDPPIHGEHGHIRTPGGILLCPSPAMQGTPEPVAEALAGLRACHDYRHRTLPPGGYRSFCPHF